MTGSARDSLNAAETTAWQSIWMENHIKKKKNYEKTFIVSCTYENTPGIQRLEGFGIQLMTAAGKKKSLSDLKSVQATVLLWEALWPGGGKRPISAKDGKSSSK